MSTGRTGAVLLACACLAACGGSASTESASNGAPAPQPPASGRSSAAASAPAAESSDPNAMPDGLPPLPTVPFPTPLPMPVVRTVFTFAAEHPEVLSKIPCFCGCQNRGHRHNDDCFVTARDASGRVTAWEPHGLG
jgi:hypothetical protein